jgi:transcriptional regulator with XRE-family HTH domain
MPVNIGEHIKSKAQEKKLSQEMLGRLINKSKQNVGDIYKRTSIDTELLLKLCRVLDFDFFALYYEEEPLKSMRTRELMQTSDKIDELEKLLEQHEDKIRYLSKTVERGDIAIQMYKEDRERYNKRPEE